MTDKEAILVENLQEAMISFKQDLALAIVSADATTQEGKAALCKAMESPIFGELGVLDVLKLRLLQPELAKHPPGIDDMRKVAPSTTMSSDYSPNLVLEKATSQSPVLVKYKYYEKGSTKHQHGQEVQKKRVATLAAMLRAASSENYLSPKCIDCFHDPDNCRYGLSLELPAQATTRPYSLRELLFNPPKFGRAGLKERFGIAKKLSEAVFKWHTSGWLHQGMASHNVIFFLDPNTSRIDYSNPHLCGFEHSRRSDEISLLRAAKVFRHDVYRHPVQQGLPIVGHRVEHDLYSLGVVLLDIGLWNPVEDLFREVVGENPVPRPTDVKNRIVNNTSHLNFYTGPKIRRRRSQIASTRTGQ